ncbi:MAG: KfrA protein, partial [Gammaproteobacteria bacterium]|nr:KfrA protein [Gammaproteobacteria bacterium]
IIHAANSLVIDGNNNPTNAQVLARIGKGSLSHISPVMREWRAARTTAISAALAMPSECREMIDLSLSQLWTVATQEAQTTLDALATERDSAVTMLTNLTADNAALVARLEERDARLHSLTADLAAVRKENRELQKELLTMARAGTKGAPG